MILQRGVPCGQMPCMVGRSHKSSGCRRMFGIQGDGQVPVVRRGLFVCSRVSQREDHQRTADEYSAGVDGERGVLDVTCVGFGSRGVDALRRVHESGCMPRTTSLWCVDTDMNMIEAAKEYADVIHMDSNKGGLVSDDVMRIIGRTASDAGGQGNIGSGDGCLAFVIAPSTGIPGGRDSLLQMTQSFRAAGHFTVAAVVSPFDFEGSLKKKQSEELVAELSALAHVVVVLDQDVLLRQSYGDEQQLTVAESTEIANTALEHTVRCVVQAVLASEMLKSTQGGLMWHGEELRHFKRLISPPLQNLLTGKGVGVLGRGLASLPQKAASSMGHTSALMHLASDAVAGAAESPFMEGVVEKARGVLCCLRIPDRSSLADVLGPTDDVEMDKAYRMAAQASAGALRTITGRGCDDFLVFIEKYRPENPSSVQVEATMLVLWSNDAAGTSKPSWKSSWNIPVHQSNKKKDAGDKGQKSWGMLSAIAGGEGKKSKIAAKEKKVPSPPVVKRPVVVKPSREEKAASRRGTQQNVTVGDYLAESLTAQSLDLPPAVCRIV